MIIRLYARKRRTVGYFRSGTKTRPKTLTRPYVKGNKLILGAGKKRRTRRKTGGQQKGGFLGPLIAALAPRAVDLLSKAFR